MSFRVSQRGMYNNSINHMNSTLSNLIDLDMKGASQKQINKPSDDPVGMARILSLRTAKVNNEQYADSIGNATGWLSQMDSTLTSVQTVLTRIKELTTQGASGTYEGTRDEIAQELRQNFEQLIQLANTKFDGRHIFSGHKYDQSAYEMGLNATCYDKDWEGTDFKVTGGTDHTVVLQFLEDGDVGTGSTAPVRFRYSKDGGTTWTEGQTTAGSNELDLDGVKVEVYPKPPNTTVPVKAVDTDDDTRNDNGTWLYVRPTAVYMGDDNYSPGDVDIQYNAANITSATGQGAFHRDVNVRIESVSGTGVRYSYSTDSGSTWTTVDSDATTYPMQLEVPGGYLNLSGGPLVAGDQFTIKPRRADLDFMISDNQTITVNNVGKDIFGGLFQSPEDGWATAVNGGDSSNMFEVVGRIIAAAETNSQQGMQEGLDELNVLMKNHTKEMAKVGGKMNRLEIVAGVLDEENYNIQSRISGIEDIDVTTLMTQMAQSQFAYKAVLQSSSMIMQMSLMQYL